MPYIEIITNTRVEKAAAAALVKELGEIIALIPGKSEQWLMVHIEDQATLSFAGDLEKPAALATLKAFGVEQSEDCYAALTKAISAACTRLLGVEAARLYTEYETTSHWGWNGANLKLKK